MSSSGTNALGYYCEIAWAARSDGDVTSENDGTCIYLERAGT